jgi:drug/metabolite transporter (DMT)-like permease
VQQAALSRGLTFVALSAASFGAMAIFARAAFASGANVNGILIARFAIAGLVLSALMLALGRPWPRGRALAFAVGMGALGYVGQAMCFFAALQYASAGLVALLLYVYPTLVCLLSAMFFGEKLTAKKLALLATGFAGLSLMLGGGGSGTPTGIALGLAAAAFYSVYIVVGARELGGTDALASTTVVCLAALAMVCAIGWVETPRFPQLAWGWAALAAIALVSTVVAILAFFAGLKRVGPSLASVVSTLEPVVTVALAWLVLGESLTTAQFLGGTLVLAAAVMLAMRTPSAAARRSGTGA